MIFLYKDNNNNEITNSNVVSESVEIKDKAYKKKKLNVSLPPVPNISDKRPKNFIHFLAFFMNFFIFI